ncbi:MAG: transglutaminase, partial [Pseudonocardia sp.]|nr:transglutaminase [Pseudonocardia sp.]
MAAGIAVVLSSTALAGVLQGFRWLWFVAVVVATVVVIGLLLRRLRVPTVAVVASQLVGLVLLITGLFSKKAVFWVLPSTETLSELSDKLSTAIGVIEGGIPPVSTTTAMSLLVAACFGLMAVAADALAAAGDG